MKLTEEQRKEFEEVTRPVIEFLNNNCHPHSHIIIETDHAELSEGIYAYPTNDYIKD